MILVADKGKIPPECHDEFLDIMDYLLLDNSLIHVLNVTNPDFFSIDEIKQILILEHIESLDGIAAVLDCHTEV